jgi:hypothetical protein
MKLGRAAAIRWTRAGFRVADDDMDKTLPRCGCVACGLACLKA